MYIIKSKLNVNKTSSWEFGRAVQGRTTKLSLITKILKSSQMNTSLSKIGFSFNLN